MRITLAQLDSVLGDTGANLAKAAETVAKAAADGSDLVLFPELFVSGYSVGLVDDDLSIRADDPRLREVAVAAGDADVAIGFVEAGPPGPHTYNSTAYFTAGRLVHVHRKLYLPTYAPFEERNHFTAGPHLRAFNGKGDTRMAVLCCNDAWQPQLAFLATQDGAQLLLMPAASSQSQFPEHYDSDEYWHDINRFYGRMFQLFVVFVNRVGEEDRFRFWGGSHIIDPWGNVIAECLHDDEHVLTVDIDLDDLRRRRRQVPLVKEARLGLLQREVSRLLDEGGDL